MTDAEYKTRSRRLALVFIGILILVIAMWYGSNKVAQRLFPSDTTTNSFEIISALFSALSVAGVIYAIFLQRLELEMQRHEIKQSTEELKGQREALNAQNFNNIFFGCLEMISGIVGNLNSTIFNNQKPFFEVKYQALDISYKNSSKPPKPQLNELLTFFSNNDWQIGHYLRSILFAMRLVHEGGGINANKGFYIQAIQSRMSIDEIRMLFYYLTYLSWNDNTKEQIAERKLLITVSKEYKFFDVLRRKGVDLIFPDNDWEYFEKSILNIQD